MNTVQQGILVNDSSVMIKTYVSREWFRQATFRKVQMTGDKEPWNAYSFFGCLL